MTKRLFDIFFSIIGIIVLSPLFIVIALIIKLDSKGPIFFRQDRVGRNFREFKILKFRSMAVDSTIKGPQITVGGDKRITRVGKFLRKYKIDELPQVINVLTGDMSFVGPRPEVPKYVDLFKNEYDKLLSIRPGITDYASFKYSNEERLLSSSEDWEEAYINKVLPEKIKLSSYYIDNRKNILTDLNLIIKTIIKI
jgi:lipopolysaccharide/colanic/teichoic acid biosynthesis glycosyltransferase